MTKPQFVQKEESVITLQNPTRETLQFMIDMLYLKVPGIRFLPFHEQANLVNYEFDSNVTELDVANLFEPSLSEEIVDLETQFQDY